MNSLHRHIHSKKLNEIESVNALQEAGIISDLCVFADDVAESDCTAAIAFLTFREIKPKVAAQVPVQNEMFNERK